MKNNLFNLRIRIGEILKKNLNESSLIEAQKVQALESGVESVFGQCNFFINGEQIMSEMAIKEVKEECIIRVGSMLGQIQANNFPYENIYAIKLGGFVLKVKDKTLPLSFEYTGGNAGAFKDFFTSFVFYVYHDSVFKTIIYNEKMENDKTFMSQLQNFLTSGEFKARFSTHNQSAKFTGEIKVLDFDKKNKIVTNYFNPVSDVEPTISREKKNFAKTKKSYKPNSPFFHRVYGKGVIKSSKKLKTEPDGDVYRVIVNFPVVGTKTIEMKNAA